MDKVRLGLIGAGGSMASSHQGYYDKVAGLDYVAACDTNADKLKSKVDEHGVKAFDSAEQLIDSGEVDAIVIATPHYKHPVYAQHAFKKGVHVLTEKPVAVTAKAAQETNDAYEAAKKDHPDLLYAGMFQQRTEPRWQAIKRMVDQGMVGELIRVSWTITDWFRSQAYYDSGGWRATWEGEGGGVLINQCPHNLDLFWWFVGLPSRVQAITKLGLYHRIEVEDQMTAVMEFPNGATGTFITSTGEAPGVNRLEIAGENGTIIADNRGLQYIRVHQGVREYTATSPERFAKPDTDVMDIKPGGKGGGHRAVTENFINVILGKEDKLIAPATEGINGLELGNAFLMSGLNNEPVDLPTNRDAFEQLLDKLKASSTFEKGEVKESAPVDMASSF
jgi:predicted dehydrogenase